MHKSYFALVLCIIYLFTTNSIIAAEKKPKSPKASAAGAGPAPEHKGAKSADDDPFSSSDTDPRPPKRRPLPAPPKDAGKAAIAILNASAHSALNTSNASEDTAAKRQRLADQPRRKKLLGRGEKEDKLQRIQVLERTVDEHSEWLDHADEAGFGRPIQEQFDGLAQDLTAYRRETRDSQRAIAQTQQELHGAIALERDKRRTLANETKGELTRQKDAINNIDRRLAEVERRPGVSDGDVDGGDDDAGPEHVPADVNRRLEENKRAIDQHQRDIEEQAGLLRTHQETADHNRQAIRRQRTRLNEQEQNIAAHNQTIAAHTDQLEANHAALETLQEAMNNLSPDQLHELRTLTPRQLRTLRNLPRPLLTALRQLSPEQITQLQQLSAQQLAGLGIVASIISGLHTMNHPAYTVPVTLMYKLLLEKALIDTIPAAVPDAAKQWVANTFSGGFYAMVLNSLITVIARKPLQSMVNRDISQTNGYKVLAGYLIVDAICEAGCYLGHQIFCLLKPKIKPKITSHKPASSTIQLGSNALQSTPNITRPTSQGIKKKLKPAARNAPSYITYARKLASWGIKAAIAIAATHIASKT